MTSRLLLAGAGSAAVAAACDGAVRALTATPPALTLCAGAVLMYAAMRRGASPATALALLAGTVVGLLLQHAAQSLPHDIGVHAPRGHIAADLFEVLDRLDADPSAYDGRVIAVSGTWTPATASDAATVSRRVMSCCAADAVDVGLMSPRAQTRTFARPRRCEFPDECAFGYAPVTYDMKSKAPTSSRRLDDPNPK